MKTELSPKRLKFINEYLKDWNATQAAIRAGYAPKNADVQGPVLLGKLRNEIQERQKRQVIKTDATVERILQELCRIAFSDTRKLFNSDGTLKPVSEWENEVAASVAGIDTLELFSGKGEHREIIGYLKKVKLWDKNKALELLGRYRQMWADKEREPAKITLEIIQFSGSGEPTIAVKVRNE